MSDHFLRVVYDSQVKTWKSVNYPFESLTKRSVGEAFLSSMRSLDENKVLEYHYDEERVKRVKDLYQESILVAANLQSLGMNKGDVVVIFAGSSYVTSSLTFGTILMGGVVNFFEVELENEDIDELLAIIKPFMIIYESKYLTRLSTSVKRRKPEALKYMLAADDNSNVNIANMLLKSIDGIDFDRFEGIHVEKPESEVAFLVLTSGSTGLPKITQLSHCLLLNGVYVWWANAYNFEPPKSDSLLFSLSPLRWISQVIILLQSAILGIKRISANKAATGNYGLEILRATNPTHLFSVPSFYHSVLLELKKDDVYSLSSLKFIQLGGERPSSIITKMSQKFAVNSKLFWSYGMSEVSCSITNEEHISGGTLQNGFEMQVLDDNLQPLDYDRHGELAIKAPFPFLGYKHTHSNDSFLKNGFFLTGDYGYFHSNNTLHLLGRSNQLIKHNDILLIPHLVESIVLDVWGVTDAILIGYCPSKTGFNEAAVLFVRLKDDLRCSKEHLIYKIRSRWRRNLSKSEIGLIHAIYFRESFPLTTCGKIDRVALQKYATEVKEQGGDTN